MSTVPNGGPLLVINPLLMCSLETNIERFSEVSLDNDFTYTFCVHMWGGRGIYLDQWFSTYYFVTPLEIKRPFHWCHLKPCETTDTNVKIHNSSEISVME